MKKSFLTLLCCSLVLLVQAGNRDSTIHYTLPDSVKAVQFFSAFTVQSVAGKKDSYAGICTELVSLELEAEKEEREIEFSFPEDAEVLVTGWGVSNEEKGELSFAYNWSTGENYQLLIAVASDSAENFSLYSGYAWLPKENKWKLIGTCKIKGRWGTIRQPSLHWSTARKGSMRLASRESWIQRSNGSWKNMGGERVTAPVISLAGHMDSVQQRQAETALIEAAIRDGKTDATGNSEGVYYKIMKEGNGRPVFVNDTVVAHYKGYLFPDGPVFDQTRETPASFPLRRLIRGWQIGVPLAKEGGKIKLVIPSDLAYSIRTRAAKIPPNSILVFEIEVVKAKAPNEEK